MVSAAVEDAGAIADVGAIVEAGVVVDVGAIAEAGAVVDAGARVGLVSAAAVAAVAYALRTPLSGSEEEQIAD